jgi:hypothetical protein
MANADTPSGAKLEGSFDQAMANGQIHAYTVLAADATALFVGDFVKLTGTLGLADDGEYYPVVTQAAATETLCGFVTGFRPNSAYLNQIHRTASTLRTVYVMDAPFARFIIQTNGTGAAADAGQNADIIVGSGSTVTGQSGMEIDQTSLTSATAQLRIIDIVRRPDNEIGANMDWICMINEHVYKSTTGA